MLVKVPFFAVLCTFLAVTLAAPLPQAGDPANLDPANLDPAVDPANLDPGIAAVDPANLDPEVADPANLDPANLDPEIVDPAVNVENVPAPKEVVEVPKHQPTPVHVPVHTPVYTPVHIPVHTPVHVPVKHVSFDNWGGYHSLKGFDDFYGVDNYDGYKFNQVFVKQEHELVCKVHEVHIIQQRLLVLQEMAKKIITETICEVEVQTIVFEQWRSSLHGFGRDLIRFPGHHQVGYDQEIVKHFPKIIKHDGSLDLADWHFTGKDLGKHTVIVKGHNWDDVRSPPLVHKAWNAARNAWHGLYGKGFNRL